MTHWNTGLTWIPATHNAAGKRAPIWNPNLGQSTVFLIKPRFNVLCEVAWTSSAQVIDESRTSRAQALYVNPGLRWAYNFKSGLQIVPGIATPIGVGPSAGQRGVVFYLSFEHPIGFASSR